MITDTFFFFLLHTYIRTRKMKSEADIKKKFPLGKEIFFEEFTKGLNNNPVHMAFMNKYFGLDGQEKD